MKSFENITTRLRNENTDIANDVEINSSREKLPNPVYYIESPDDSTVLIGINVSIEHYRNNKKDVHIVDWYDTSHERRMTADEIKQKGDYFAFKRAEKEGGGLYFFTPMNLKIFNDKVKQQLDADEDFTNEEDLTKAFLATLEDGF